MTATADNVPEDMEILRDEDLAHPLPTSAAAMQALRFTLFRPHRHLPWLVPWAGATLAVLMAAEPAAGWLTASAVAVAVLTLLAGLGVMRAVIARGGALPYPAILFAVRVPALALAGAALAVIVSLGTALVVAAIISLPGIVRFGAETMWNVTVLGEDAGGLLLYAALAVWLAGAGTLLYMAVRFVPLLPHLVASGQLSVYTAWFLMKGNQLRFAVLALAALLLFAGLGGAVLALTVGLSEKIGGPAAGLLVSDLRGLLPGAAASYLPAPAVTAEPLTLGQLAVARSVELALAGLALVYWAAFIAYVYASLMGAAYDSLATAHQRRAYVKNAMRSTEAERRQGDGMPSARPAVEAGADAAPGHGRIGS